MTEVLLTVKGDRQAGKTSWINAVTNERGEMHVKLNGKYYILRFEDVLVTTKSSIVFCAPIACRDSSPGIKVKETSPADVLVVSFSDRKDLQVPPHLRGKVLRVSSVSKYNIHAPAIKAFLRNMGMNDTDIQRKGYDLTIL